MVITHSQTGEKTRAYVSESQILQCVSDAKGETSRGEKR
jgi:hypothetical protein